LRKNDHVGTHSVRLEILNPTMWAIPGFIGPCSDFPNLKEILLVKQGYFTLQLSELRKNDHVGTHSVRLEILNPTMWAILGFVDFEVHKNGH